uniref:VP10 protein n=1 Tax=Calla Lily Valley virus TaxID=3139873 RepID=A0AAN0N8C6_9VIRU
MPVYHSILLLPPVRTALNYEFRGHKMKRLPSNLHTALTQLSSFCQRYLDSVSGIGNLHTLRRALFHGRTLNLLVITRNDLDRQAAVGWLQSQGELQSIPIGKTLADIEGTRSVHYPVCVLTKKEADDGTRWVNRMAVQWHPNGKRDIERILHHLELFKVFLGGIGVYIQLNSDEVRRIPDWAITLQEMWRVQKMKSSDAVAFPNGFLVDQFIMDQVAITTTDLSRDRDAARAELTRGVKYIRDQTLVVDHSLRALDLVLRHKLKPHQVVENGVEITLSLCVRKRENASIFGPHLPVGRWEEQLIVPVSQGSSFSAGSIGTTELVSLVYSVVQFPKNSRINWVLRSLDLLDVEAKVLQTERVLIDVPRDVYKLLDQLMFEKNSNLLYIVGNKGIGKTRLGHVLVTKGYHVFDSDMYGRIITLAKSCDSLDQAIDHYLELSPQDRSEIEPYFEWVMKTIIGDHSGPVLPDLRDDHSTILGRFREVYGALRLEYKNSYIFSEIMKRGLERRSVCDYGSIISDERFCFVAHTIPEIESMMSGVRCQLVNDNSTSVTLAMREQRGFGSFYVGYGLQRFYGLTSSQVCPTMNLGWLIEILRVGG